jgi:hypothetical protein
MSDNNATTVNSQITDSVTQTNVKVVGKAPAMAMSALYQTMAQSTGILMQNAVAAQQQMSIISQATTTQGVAMIYAAGTSAGAADISKNIDETKK